MEIHGDKRRKSCPRLELPMDMAKTEPVTVLILGMKVTVIMTILVSSVADMSPRLR
jgi:hypothetical protein